MIKPKFAFILILWVCCAVPRLLKADSITPSNKGGLSGNILLDSNWNRVVYLSFIPTMNDRFTMSHSFIIDEAEMDSLGNFRFNAKYWPIEDALYRIHIVKREDPVASLIIGGREENFYLFVANRQDSLFLDGSAGFARAVIKGSESNGLLLQMKGWVDFADSSTFAGTPIKRELIENAISEKLRQVADTIEYPLVALMALYYTDFKSNQKLNSQYYQDFWKGGRMKIQRISSFFELKLKVKTKRILLFGFTSLPLFLLYL